MPMARRISAPIGQSSESTAIGLPSSALERNCSVARTLDILSDSWSFLLIRECFFGARRFDEFQGILKLPRGTLTEVLKKLMNESILNRVQYSARPPRFEYRLTEMGMDLYPTMLALMIFGDKWLTSGGKAPLQLRHKACQCCCAPQVTCSVCGCEISANRVSYRDGPGAGAVIPSIRRRSHRPSKPDQLERTRPCSVARTLRAIGDRWSFLIIREAFFGIRRFDELQFKLGIAPGILTDRLLRLTAEEIFARSKYRDRPERFEYRLTEKGKDLYGPLIVMMRWGDHWLSDGRLPLKIRHLDCDSDFEPIVSCNRCGNELKAREAEYSLAYRL